MLYLKNKFFAVVPASTLSGTQYSTWKPRNTSRQLFVRLSTSIVPCAPTSNSIAQAMTMLLDLLE